MVVNDGMGKLCLQLFFQLIFDFEFIFIFAMCSLCINDLLVLVR